MNWMTPSGSVSGIGGFLVLLTSRMKPRTLVVLGKMDKACEMKRTVLDSPLGKLELSGCEQGLHEIKLLGKGTPKADAMEVPAPAEVLGGPEPLMQCTAWLNAYFYQPEAIEELPVPALHHPVFQQESFTRQVLWKLLKVVKFGEVISYQQLAALAGNPKAARAVGGAMRNNPVPGVQQLAKQTKRPTCEVPAS
ncbi:methylated-DNA--protein-cysteine methyltransferase isoform X4 [Piliocolobus tephrosceles]|uniref:methylated-DNA--protein-cysteine methyltransferase isoform X4 n=1 Tax=Piliocolobus tephrosceles TaxID=591936 RepID=UPI000E6B0034|nr:methylated-DNA--protein-cysteine methyltransferase isoform X4 [Piliocolobus tephrosceles]